MSLVETLELPVKAREYVAEGEECLVDQRNIVDRLERRGQDPLDAILFLKLSKTYKRNTLIIGIALSGKS